MTLPENIDQLPTKGWHEAIFLEAERIETRFGKPVKWLFAVQGCGRITAMTTDKGDRFFKFLDNVCKERVFFLDHLPEGMYAEVFIEHRHHSEEAVFATITDIRPLEVPGDQD